MSVSVYLFVCIPQALVLYQRPEFWDHFGFYLGHLCQLFLQPLVLLHDVVVYWE